MKRVTDAAADHNDALRAPRTCIHCGHTSVPTPSRPGWTPAPELGGWTCPDCSNKGRAR